MANVWDAASAHAASEVGYQAIGTSSAAIANLLGYADGEDLPLSSLKSHLVRIAAATSLPLSIDMENGYGREASQVVSNLVSIAELGAVGVNLEDSIMIGGKRCLQDVGEFASRLEEIKRNLDSLGIRLFLNIRTDPFLLGLPQASKEAIQRGRIYAEAGADGLFVPCITSESDIASVVESVPLPLNVMCMPELPGFDKLGALGVKRISMGNFVHDFLQRTLVETLRAIRETHSFQPIFPAC